MILDKLNILNKHAPTPRKKNIIFMPNKYYLRRFDYKHSTHLSHGLFFFFLDDPNYLDTTTVKLTTTAPTTSMPTGKTSTVTSLSYSTTTVEQSSSMLSSTTSSSKPKTTSTQSTVSSGKQHNRMCDILQKSTNVLMSHIILVCYIIVY